MKGTITAGAIVLLCLSVFTAKVAGAGQTACPMNLPSGILVRIYPDETIIAGKTSGPLMFTVASDARLFPLPNRPVLVPHELVPILHVRTHLNPHFFKHTPV